MNNEDKIHINSFKFYDRDELEEITKQYYLENKQLKEKIDCDLKWAFKCDELTKESQKLKEEKRGKREFVEYLEEAIKIIIEGNPTNISEYTAGKLDALKETLSKYKEIIGGKDEGNKKL